jgi:hypothetical protein
MAEKNWMVTVTVGFEPTKAAKAKANKRNTPIFPDENRDVTFRAVRPQLTDAMNVAMDGVQNAKGTLTHCWIQCERVDELL